MILFIGHKTPPLDKILENLHLDDENWDLKQ